MRSIGIVGAGQAGIVLGAELLRTGFAVTLYSDRTPDDYLEDRGRPTACLWGDQVVQERDLGLDFWDGRAPDIERIHLDLCGPGPAVAFSIVGKLRRPAMAVDQRLKFSHGMRALGQRGAEIVVDHISIPKLEVLTAEHDLVVIAAGQRELGQSLFERDPARSVHDRPRRTLFMLNVQGYALSARPDHEDLSFSFVPGVMEIFWVPFLDKDAGVSRSVLVEAVPGGPADRFGGVESADQGFDVLCGLVRDLLPWETDFLAPARPTSPLTWLKGAIVPVVRKPVGVLPSGRHVLGLGDAVVLNDPMAAQGANNATRMAHFFAERMVKRGDEPFGAGWLSGQFDDFWEYGRYVNDFSNALLEPLEPFQQNLFIAASRKPEIAELIFEGFNDPASVFPWFGEPEAARSFLAEHGVGRADLLRYKLGLLRRKVFG